MALLPAVVAGGRGTAAPRARGPAAEGHEGAVWVTTANGIDAAAAVLLLGGRRGGTLESEVAALPAVRHADRCSVGFWIEVRGADLLGGQSASVVRLEAFAYGLGDDGGVVGFWGRTLHMSLAAVEEQVARAGVRIAGSVAVPCRAPSVRYLVRNPATTGYSVGGLRVEAPEGDPEAPLLCVFPSPTGRWLDVRAAPEPTVASDRTAGPGTPLTSRPVVPAPGVVRFALIGPPRWADATLVGGRLRSAAGTAVASGSFEVVSVRRIAGGSVAIETDWFVPALEPGPWSLELQLRDAGGLAAAAAPVRVEVVEAGSGLEGAVWAERPRPPAPAPTPGKGAPVEG